MSDTFGSLEAMTEQEVLIFTDERIRRMIDLICLEQGIPLLPVLPEEPPKPNHEPDLTLYSVGSYLGYLAAAQAEHVLSVAKSYPLYDASHQSFGQTRTSSGYADHAVTKIIAKPVTEGNYNFPAMTAKTAFSEVLWTKVKGDFEAYGALKAQYDAAKKQYDSIISQRKENEDAVWEIVNNARTAEYRRNVHRREFARYLELSNGERRTALKFYANSHGGFEGDYPELVNEFLGHNREATVNVNAR